MVRGCIVVTGFIAILGSTACDGAGADQSPGSVQYVPTTPAIQSQGPAGAPAAPPAPIVPSQPSAAAPPAAVPAAAVPAAAVPAAAVPAAAVPAAPKPAEGAPAAAAPAAQPSAAMPPAAAPAATAGSAAPAAPKPADTSAFNAGSGTMQPDGKTVVYHIPDGTGGTDWNKKDNPIRVQHGMTLRLIDDDKSTKAGGHWLHTYGQPCAHGTKAIGTGFDCVISQKASVGLQSGVAEHNIANGIGHLYIEVVAN